LEEALLHFSEAGIEERGGIFTRREVVEFILDLTGYTADKPLYSRTLLEPSFGEGDFLLVAVERLLVAYQLNTQSMLNIASDLRDSIRAVELHPETFQRAYEKLNLLLRKFDITQSDADALLGKWLVCGDFLLTDLPFKFSYVVGNPPYVRQEMIPDTLLLEYRRRFKTIFDRADLYVPFIEKSLSLLAPQGSLGFICADRWMKNKYGGPLRRLVAEKYHLEYYVDMFDTEAFSVDVTTYPAVTVIVNEKAGPTRIASRPPIDAAFLETLARELKSGGRNNSAIWEVSEVAAGSEPWILHSFDQLALVRRLEEQFPIIEETGCNVGIGVASGADDVFIGKFDELDVEPSRKLPLVMTEDIIDGTVKWLGRGIMNPFKDDGKLVNLRDFPKLAAFVKRNEHLLRGRHVARQNPNNWYRTIDRIYPELVRKPKLLIPDIKGTAHVVYEDGRFYPHHNLYYITSEEWDLRALQAVLVSGIARLFVSVYSTRMRGGYLRFQAQYLRRIRLPRWTEIPEAIKAELIDAAGRGDAQACNTATFKLYGLSKQGKMAIGGNGE